MRLSEVNSAQAMVQVPGGEIAVRGLSLEDILALVRKHSGPLGELFNEYAIGMVDVSMDDAMQMGGKLIEVAPDIAAEIIAMGADEPSAAASARKLPFSTQVEAIEKIGELTFMTEGGPKKVVETVIRMMRGTTATLNDLQR